MNEMIIKNWNDVVSPDDTVYHLGDVALGPWVEWDGILTRLNGYKILVVGNHDRIFAGEKDKQRDRFRPYYESWFDEIHDSMTVVFDSREAVGWDHQITRLSHFPYDGDSHGDERHREFRLEDKGVPLIHGHTHDPNQWFTLSKKGTPMFHVGQDAHNYTPVHEDVIVSWLESL